MKKVLFPLIALLFQLSAMAQRFTVGDLDYRVTGDGEVSLSRCGWGVSGDLVIPATVSYEGTDYTVTSIGDMAFMDSWELTSVTIPSSVTSIAEGTFQNSGMLTAINVDENNPVYSSADGVLYNKDKTTLLQCPGGKNGAVTIPGSVTSIGESAFQGCGGLTSVTIPGSVTSIGYGAFLNCGGLTSIETDAANAVYCSIDGVLFNKDKTEILFCPAGKTGTYDIPSSVTSIGGGAFQACFGLTSVTIPSSVTSIGNDAFSVCRGLTSVTIPSSVTSIGNNAFSQCSNLTSVTIPSSVTSIGNSAFSFCEGLTSVTLPSSVTSIGSLLFYYCESLTSVTIPSSVTSIGDMAFYHCSRLTSVTIPNSVTSIGMSVFNDCSSLTSVTIPGSVTSIGDYAFNYCTGLTSIYMEGIQPPTTGTDILERVPGNCVIYVPAGCGDAYDRDPWNKYSRQKYVAEKMYLPDGKLFEYDESHSVPQLTYAREFTNKNWQALYVPFAMNYADWQADFDVARINNMHQYDDNQDGTVDRTELEAVFLKEGRTIEANRPYLIRAKAEGKKVLTLTNATLGISVENSIDCSSVDTKYTFTGTYRGIPGAEMLSGGYYALADGELKQAANENVALGTFRWYMKAESRDGSAAKLPARMKLRVVDPSAGGVTGIEEATTTAKSAAVEAYTLDGRRAGRFGSMDEARKQLPKGFYIVNGKKVLF